MAKKASDSKERQTTTVLIALVIVFLCCNTLAFLANIMVSILLKKTLLKLSIIIGKPGIRRQSILWNNGYV
jgi:hypothetical protein